MKSILAGSLQDSGYGAPELRQYYQKYMSRSLALSILLQVACVASYYAFRAPEGRSELPRVAGILSPGSITLPPFFPRTKFTTYSSVPKSRFGLEHAIPIPAAVPLMDSSSTIPFAGQPGDEPGPVDGVPSGGYDNGQTGGWSNDDVEPPPFQPVEKPPELVKRVEPTYPPNAVRAEIQGTVVLIVWVDREGKVRKAVVLKTDAEILNAAAIEAAKQWIFTPAIMQHGPVSVWVSIPFRFKLRGQ